MSFSKVVLGSFVAALFFQGADSAACSAACKTCCPVGSSPKPNGDCIVDMTGEHDCHLVEGECRGSTQGKACPASKPASVEITPPVGIQTLQKDKSTDLTISTSFLHDGLPAWSDFPKSEIRAPPQFMIGMPVTIPSSTISGGSAVTFHCPEGQGYLLCDAYVLYYSCPDCLTNVGGLGAVLQKNGWMTSRCTPKFVTGAMGGFEHQTRGWRKSVPTGESESFIIPRDAEFVFFGIDGTGVDCSTFQTENTCEDHHLGGICQWNYKKEECGHNTCFPLPQGPFPKCSYCLSDELP